jgi:glycosyltransferase involved in cell wall biosynthesis
MIKRCSGRFIAASGAVKKYLVDHQEIHAETIRVVHAGVEIGRFDGNESVGEIKKRLGLENCFVIGTVGRITHVKGSDLFVKLASNLKRRHSGSVKLKFLVVATTADKEFFKIFTALLHQHELEQDVVIVKDVPDTSAYFSAMDIYVSTAREDPFPVVILEAMAARKPVVGFAVGGIPEAVTSESGILIEGDDVEIMTKEVAGLIHDSDRRLRLGLAGRKRVEEYFTLTRYAAEMTTLIEKAIR